MSRPFAVLAAALFVAGCGPDDAGSADGAVSDEAVPGARTATVRDSAGTTLVSYAARPTPRTVDEPVLSLGVVEGRAPEQLHRVTTPFLRADGTVVVPNSGTSELRFFGPDGSFLKTVGREGDGPDEFRSLTWVRPYRGDSLAVWDVRLARITILDGRGEVVRSFRPGAEKRTETEAPAVGEADTTPGTGARSAGAAMPSSALPEPGGLVRVIDVLADGRFLARRGEIVVGARGRAAATRDAMRRASRDTTAVRRDRFPYILLDPEGRHVGELTSLPDDEQFVWSEGGSRSVRPRAFGKTTSVVAAGDRVYVAANDAFRVRILDASGRVIRLVAGSAAARIVGEADRTRWLESELDKLADSFLRRVAEAALRAMDFPERMPWHADLVVGADERIWLEEYRAPHLNEPSTWTVLDPAGRNPVVRVRFPPGFRLTWAGARKALGVLRDELDVERVVLYELPSPAVSSG